MLFVYAKSSMSLLIAACSRRLILNRADLLYHVVVSAHAWAIEILRSLNDFMGILFPSMSNSILRGGYLWWERVVIECLMFLMFFFFIVRSCVIFACSSEWRTIGLWAFWVKKENYINNNNIWIVTKLFPYHIQRDFKMISSTYTSIERWYMHINSSRTKLIYTQPTHSSGIHIIWYLFFISFDIINCSGNATYMRPFIEASPVAYKT